jgi:hypothetical protein
MEKQRTVNTVTANDGFSSGLMEAYDRWMGGDTFQNSTIKEEEGIPTGQKQGGEGTGAFTSVGGELPAVEFDTSTGLPTIPVVNTDNDSTKDPKATSNGAEPPTNKNGLKPKYGAQIKNTVLVGANEVADDRSYVRCGKCGGRHLTKDCDATNEEIENYHWDSVSKSLTLLGELTDSKYTVKGEKLNEEVKEEPEINIMDTEEWKDAAKKQTSKIMAMWKKG